MHIRRQHIVSLLLLAGISAALASPAETIRSRELYYHTSMRGIVFAEEGETITNPLDWPHVKYVVPDGVHVERGDLITEFGSEAIERHLSELRLRGNEAELELENKTIQLHNREMDLRDERDERLDDLAVLETRLARLRSLPDPSEVEIARGRLAVSRLEYEAAEKDAATARDRLGRGMISPAEFDKFERAYLNRKAQLAYRRGMLEYASRPAKEVDLRTLEFQVENTRLDIDRLRNEIEENVKLSEIERRGTEARAASRMQRVQTTEEDLKKTVVRAPISGYVVYLPAFRERVERTGEKLFRNLAYLRIPNQDTLRLKGTIFEHERRFFEVGDRVVVRTTAHPEKPIHGQVAALSMMPRDRGEKEDEQWLRESDSGIMVYDVVVTCTETPSWLRVGMTAECELTSGRSVTGPSVPSTYVRVRDNEYYLSFNGIYRKVHGFVLDGFFVLSDAEMEGRDVDWVGEFPEQHSEPLSGTAPAPESPFTAAASGRLSISGELVPADTMDVEVGPIYGQQKVVWLIPEDTQVEAGEVVARLDPADTDEEIKEQETHLERAVSRREGEEEGVKRRNRANEFRLEQAAKQLAIAELQLEDLQTPKVTPQLLSARQAVALAGIRLEFLERELKRREGMTANALSPMEVERLRRDRTRAALQLETAQIQLKQIEDGPDEAAVCRAELKVLEARSTAELLGKRLETDEARYNYGLRRARRYERWRSNRVEWLRKQRDNLTIKAPRAGLIRYSRVWNSGVWSKAHVGSMARQRTKLMTVANISRMYVRLEVPERYFPLVFPGMEVDVRAPSLTDGILVGRVTKTEFLFQPRRKKDSERGLYSSHEELGETVFFAHVEIAAGQGVALKPGAVAEVFFPFDRSKPPTQPNGDATVAAAARPAAGGGQ